MQTAIQLYSLRGLDEPVTDLIERVGETPLAGVEFAGLGESDPDRVGRALEAAGLQAAGAHVGADELEDDPGAVCDAYRRLSCRDLIVPYLDDTHFTGEDAVGATARRLAELGEAVAARDARLGYHNHDHEFVELDGTTAYEALADALAAEDEVSLELDAGWALAAGYDPAGLLDRLGSQVTHVHLKDVDARLATPVELGQGDLDLPTVVDAARRAGVDWLVYEYEEPEDPAESLRHAGQRLPELVGR